MAKASGFSLTTAELEIINGLCADYGDEAVKYGLKQCVENGVCKIAYLRKVLENKKNGIGKPQPRAAPGKVLRETQYEQREYEAGECAQEYLSAMRAMLAGNGNEHDQLEDGTNETQREQ